ncbi:hypothetical protein [Methylobacterium oryzisoli]|uniref:hypothetical protein n=1 Tax=Methylobacterium oryzisoli TaxID=3385502 RepID=UPI003891980E
MDGRPGEKRRWIIVLIGQRKAIGMAVRGGTAKRRYTKMQEWLALADGCGRRKAPG